MSRWLAAFCWLVSQLDRLPRYGRSYGTTRDADGHLHINTTPSWSYQPWGRWGFYLLIRLKLFWRYERYLEEKARRSR